MSRLEAVQRRWRPAIRALAVVGVLAYSWWATTFRPFTRPIQIVTAIPGVVVLLIAARNRRRRLGLRVWLSEWKLALSEAHPATAMRHRVAWRAGTVVWSLLIAAIAGWELVARLNAPRSMYPTLSSLSDSVTRLHSVRFLAFVLWLLFGRDLLRR